MSSFKFEILHQSKRSRAHGGRIYTPHGTIFALSGQVSALPLAGIAFRKRQP